jgi:ribosomal protein S27AE
MKYRYNYSTLKVSEDSRRLLAEVMADAFYSRVNVKDVITFAWPKCPKCGGPLVQKFASSNLFCVRCRAEYKLAEGHV